MATNNFHNENASKIFACLGTYETPVLDNDGNETDEMEFYTPEQWEYDDFKENLCEDLKSTFGYDDPTTKDVSELRSFPSSVIADKSVTKDFGNGYVQIDIAAIIRGGYYDGCNLDWQVGINVCGNDYDDGYESLESIAEDFEYHTDMNEGMAKIQAKNVLNWIEKTKAELVEELEKVFTTYSEPLVKVAQFSNGEAVYEKADTLKAKLATNNLI